MFRNESTNVIRKAKAKAASRRRSIPPRSNPSTPAREQDKENSLMLVRRDHAPASTFLNNFYSMAPTIDERAIGFFFTNYVIDIDVRPSNSAGYGIDENLSNSMKAVALAALASAAHAPELKREVRSFGVALSDSRLSF